MEKAKVIIAGAAGRDFHNFNVFFRNNDQFEVVAFTATQIPDIEGRIYPPELSGSLYPDGIKIHPESELPELIKKHQVDQVILAYSDIPNQYVMTFASKVMAAGADFWLMGPKSVMLPSQKPVISVTAARTGAGKSQTSRSVCHYLKDQGKNVVVIRHPMPYGDLTKQICQRFATYEDMDKHECTIEEREEYEPHIDKGIVVYAGVDYEKILAEAEKEADVIVWDGGNNDFSFYKSDITIVLTDPHRANHELSYHPGETNLRMADCIVINKIDTADWKDVQVLRKNIEEANPKAVVVEAASPLSFESDECLKGKKGLVIEDGPTLTHGEMPYGAGFIAAEKMGVEMIDPRPFAVGSIKETYKNYPHMGPCLPAMGYGKKQILELEETINKSEAEIAIVATPIDLRKLVDFTMKPIRVRYELQEIGQPTLKEFLQGRF